SNRKQVPKQIDQIWIGSTVDVSSKKIYESVERSTAIQLCGWDSLIINDTDHQRHSDKIKSLLEIGQYGKAAALYIFQMNLDKAIQVLNEGLSKGGNENLATLILALIGCVTTTNHQNTFFDYTNITKKFEDSYIRAMFAFILSDDAQQDQNYSNVLDEQLDLNDKVGFSCRYLNDQCLDIYLDKLSMESKSKGDLQGIILTGLRTSGCELIQKYLENTNDIRTVALLAIHVPEDIVQDCPYVREWLEGYRNLLDQLQMWTERAEVDVYRNQMSHTRSNISDMREIDINCIFCNSLLDQSRSANRRERHNTSHIGSSSTVLMVCSKCRQSLPRCAVCMMNLSNYIEDSSCSPNSQPDKYHLLSSQWFTWCKKCRHGGHAEHVNNWFKYNKECPVAKCLCPCTITDGYY
ncbi:unnamed protein product, partial [Didymodactylos carnosus]